MNGIILILVGLIAVLMTSLWYLETQRSERYKESAGEWKRIAHKWFKLVKECTVKLCKQEKTEKDKNGCIPTKYAKVTLKTGDVYFGIHDSKSTNDVMIIIQEGCECKSFRMEEIENIEYAVLGTPLFENFNITESGASHVGCGWVVDGGALNTVLSVGKVDYTPIKQKGIKMYTINTESASLTVYADDYALMHGKYKFIRKGCGLMLEIESSQVVSITGDDEIDPNTETK